MTPSFLCRDAAKRVLAVAFVFALIWAFLAGCTAPKPGAPGQKPKPYRVGKQWYHPVSDAEGFRQKGNASWYGKKFHGRTTSSGEIYDMYQMTAAHKTLPLGTYVSVKNLDNRKEVVVRVNDRGPFVRGRIIDLSYQAAKKLEIVGPGTAPVEIVALGRSSAVSEKQPTAFTPIDYYTGNFTFQVGAFKNRSNALKLKDDLSKRYKHVHVTRYDNGSQTLYRVRVGRATSLSQAGEYEAILIQHGFTDVFIVAE